MNRRIEFTLNLDDPADAELYTMLSGPLRHRRAASLIRQALTAYLLGAGKAGAARRSASAPPQIEVLDDTRLDSEAAAHLVEQSAEMFDF